MRIRLNLIPERVLREREARSRRRVLLGIPLIGIALVVVLYLLLAAREGQANLIARNAELFLAPLRSVASFTQSLAFVPGVTQVNLQSIQQVAAAGEGITRYQIAARLREGP